MKWQFRSARAGWVLGVAFHLTAHAVEFGSAHGVRGTFDTTVSYAAGWRVQGRDPTLVGANNGGAGGNNADDGNLNYHRGDLFASLLKVTHELDLTYRQMGFFARGDYFYDFENALRTGPAPVVSGVSGAGYTFGEGAKNSVGRGARVLDAYFKGAFDVDARKLQVRAGSQVVNWGEGVYIGNGINAINAVDLDRLRTPGQEIKDALLPTPMLWVSRELSPLVDLEGFSIFEFRKTELDARGTYFSANDFLSRDGSVVYLSGPDQHFAPLPGITQWLQRAPDRKAGNTGEFGLALRARAPGRRDTGFGLYYLNYHQRTPMVSARRGGVNIAGVAGPIDASTSTPASAPAQFFAEYPENVHLMGLSFYAPGPWGVGFTGEYSLRSRMPLQIALNEVVLAAMGLQNSLTGSAAAAAAVPDGTEVSGYRRVRMHQAQLAGSKSFPRWLGASQVSVRGEVGATWLELPAGVFFGGYGETTAPGSFGASGVGVGQGFATRSSWGYQLRIQADYNDLIDRVRLAPRLAYAQAINGVSPTFNEGVRSWNFGLAAQIRAQWQVDVSYTEYSGGRLFLGAINTNPVMDRDFASVRVSYVF